MDGQEFLGRFRKREGRLERPLARDAMALAEAVNRETRSPHELPSDDMLLGAVTENQFRSAAEPLKYGRVVYAIPYANWYAVALDDLDGVFPCCHGTETSLQPGSTRSTSPISSGSNVLVWKPPRGSYGVILCVLPDPIVDANTVFPDWVVQGSGGGAKREPYYAAAFSLLQNAGDIIDFSNWRPLDSSASGEWGRMSDHGSGIHIDPFLTFLRVAETCGLWLHYMDKHARLAGYNFDLQTAVSELQVRNDQGEGQIYYGSTPYPWEAAGRGGPGEDPARDIADMAVHYTLPYGRYEPTVDDQQPVYRYEEWEGYLGQGAQRTVSLPFQTASPNTYSSTAAQTGLFREHIGLNGSWSVDTAHSAAIRKRYFFPMPKRIRPAEHLAGDTPSNYRFAGQLGAGEAHVRGGQYDTEGHPAKYALGVSDFITHLTNWGALLGFTYHGNDFVMPEDGLGIDGLPAEANFANFSELQSSQWLSSPPLETIDGPGASDDYYVAECGSYWLPDGSQVHRGRGGQEIRFVGGDIEISCPGDIIFRSGRNTVTMAGQDVIHRAHKSLEASAGKGSMRLKADRHLDLLAGNSGTGRLLLETRGIGTTPGQPDTSADEQSAAGVIIKAAQSPFVAWAQRMYLRTGSERGITAEGDVRSGPIVLDADHGRQDITTVSSSFTRHLGLQAQDVFPIDDEKTAVNNWSAVNAQIATPAQFGGGLAVLQGGLQMKGNLNIVEGHIGTQKANEFNGLVGSLSGSSLSLTRANLELVKSQLATLIQNAGESFQSAFTENVYADGGLGAEDTQRATQFGFRKDEQYHAGELQLVEGFWQQIARITGQQLPTWDEPTVDYQSAPTSPWPGYNTWHESESLKQLDLNLLDDETGWPKSRKDNAATYSGTKLKTLTGRVPNQNYPVVSS